MTRPSRGLPLRQLPSDPVGFVYARASVDRQQTGISVDGQIRDGRDHADDHNVRVAHVFRDDDRSASEFAQRQREDYEAMVPQVAAGAVHVVIATEVARLSRLLDEWIVLRKALRDTGTLLLLSGRLYDMRDERDNHTITQEVVQAEAEAARARQRTTRSTRQRAADGEVHGPAPYGYRRRYHAVTRKLIAQEPDPAEAEVVEEIVTRVAAMESIIGIAADLSDRGVPTPRGAAAWHPNTVREIARNPAYVGVRSHGGEQFPGRWDPIVDEAAHLAAVERLAEAEPDGGRRREAGAVHLLSGIARCSECGTRMYRHTVKGLFVYRCRKRGCLRVSVNQEALDVYVVAAVLGWLERPGRREQVLAGSGQQRAAEALAQVRRLNVELEEAYALSEAGELTARGLASREKQLLPLLRAARAEAGRAVLPRAASRVLREDVRQVWPGLTLGERRESVQVVAGVVVTPIGAGVRHPRRVMSRRVRLSWLLDQGS